MDEDDELCGPQGFGSVTENSGKSIWDILLGSHWSVTEGTCPLWLQGSIYSCAGAPSWNICTVRLLSYCALFAQNEGRWDG